MPAALFEEERYPDWHDRAHAMPSAIPAAITSEEVQAATGATLHTIGQVTEMQIPA